MARQTHLAAGAVANQKIQRHRINILHMRIMAALALHVATHQMYFMLRISCLLALDQALYQIW